MGETEEANCVLKLHSSFIVLIASQLILNESPIVCDEKVIIKRRIEKDVKDISSILPIVVSQMQSKT